jgi:MOB kinase activator 1
VLLYRPPAVYLHGLCLYHSFPFPFFSGPLTTLCLSSIISGSFSSSIVFFPPETLSSRTMARAQRPKRSPTPISAAVSPVDTQPPSSPALPASKPLYLCSPFVEAALVKGNFKTIVMLPKYVDIMEWVAVNSAFLTRLTPCFLGKSQRVLRCHSGMLHTKKLSDDVSRLDVCCLSRPCPIICCSSLKRRLNYTWINQDRKSVHLPAPTYIDYVMTWVQNLLDDENSFPTKSGKLPSCIPSHS